MNSATQPSAKIVCRNLWKVFGNHPEQLLASITEDASREQILARTGQVVAVRDVSFTVHTGETFVVMGLSGSGKSTLLRCLPRLIEPTRGEILIDGQSITQLDEAQLRQIRRHKLSMVFQHFGLFPHRSVLENVAFGLEIQGVKPEIRQQRARAVLELVNLQQWGDAYPSQLSGGMQQRVGLARALAVDPEILLFDEPFSALDPLIRREMQDELLRLQEQMQKTLIFITHDFAEAIKLGDQIAIMKDGQFVQVGTPEALVLHPADAYVAAFTKDVPRVKVLTARAVMRPVETAPTSEHAISVTIKLEELIPILTVSDAVFPVVDESDHLVGCVDRTAVLSALAEQPDPA